MSLTRYYSHCHYSSKDGDIQEHVEEITTNGLRRFGIGDQQRREEKSRCNAKLTAPYCNAACCRNLQMKESDKLYYARIKMVTEHKALQFQINYVRPVVSEILECHYNKIY